MDLIERGQITSLLERVSANDLDWIQQKAAEAKEQRFTRRKKELWGNVRAAIKKYIAETGDHILLYERDGNGQYYVLVDDELDELGTMYFD